MPMGGTKLGKAYATLRLETDKFNRQLSKSQRNFKSASNDIKRRSKRLGKSIKRMGMVAAAGMAAVGTAAWKMADSFGEAQKEARQVFTLMDTSEAQFEALRDDISALGKEYGIMQTEAMNAWYQITSATYEGVEATKMFEQSAKAAVAGATDQKTAADALTSVMNAYGKDIEEVDDVSDTFFKTVQRGKTTFEELGKEISAVTSLAPTMGIEFEEIGAALATLTRAGQDTAEATTNLGRLITEMGVKPSKDLLEVLHDIGYEGETAGKKILEAEGLYGAIQTIGDELDRQGKSWETMMKRQQALRAALILTGKGAKGFAKDMELMDDKAGSTEEAFSKMENTFWYVKRQMLAAIDELVKSFGSKFAPAITDLIRDEIMPALDDFDEWVGGISGMKAKLTDFFNKATTAARGFFKVMTNVSEIVVNVTNWTFNIADAEAKANKKLAAAFGLATVVAGAVEGFILFGWPGLIAGALIAGWAAGRAIKLDPIDIVLPLNISPDVNVDWGEKGKMLKEGNFLAALLGLSSEDVKNMKWDLWQEAGKGNAPREQALSYISKSGGYEANEKTAKTIDNMWHEAYKMAEKRQEKIDQEVDYEQSILGLREEGLAAITEQRTSIAPTTPKDKFGRWPEPTPAAVSRPDRTVVKRTKEYIGTMNDLRESTLRRISEERKVTDTVKAIWEGYKDWLSGFEEAKEIIGVKAQIFGDEFDATREKLSLYKRSISKLLEEGYRPQDKELKGIIEAYNNLKAKTEDVTKALTNLEKTIADQISGLFGDFAPLISAMLEDLFESINLSDVAKKASGAVKDAYEGITSQLTKVFKPIKTVFNIKPLMDDVANMFGGFASAMSGYISPIIQILSSAFQTTKQYEQMQRILTKALEAIGKAIGPLVQPLLDIAELATNVLAPALEIAGKVVQAFADAVRWAINAIISIINIIPFVHIDKVGKEAKESSDRLQKFKDVLSSVNNALQDFADTIGGFISGLLGPLGGAVDALIGGIFDATSAIISNLDDPLKAVTGIFDALVGAATGLLDMFFNLVKQGDAYQALQDALEPIWEALADAISSFLWPLVAAVNWLKDFLGIADQVSDEAAEIADLNVAEGFKRARNVWAAATSGEPATTAGGGNGGYTVPDWAKDIGEEIGKWIANTLGLKEDENIFDTIKEKIEKWWEDLDLPDFSEWDFGPLDDFIEGIKWKKLKEQINDIISSLNDVNWKTVGKELSEFLNEGLASINEIIGRLEDMFNLGNGNGDGKSQKEKWAYQLEKGGVMLRALTVSAVSALAKSLVESGKLAQKEFEAFLAYVQSDEWNKAADWVLENLQHGGIATGPTPALIGEAGPEAVIPLDRMGDFGGNVIVVEHKTQLDGKTIHESVTKYEQRDQYRKTGAPTGGGYARS